MFSWVLLPWSGGLVKCSMLPKLGSLAFYLLQQQLHGGEDLTATKERDPCKVCDFQQYLRIRFFNHTMEFGPQWHLCLGGWRGVIHLYAMLYRNCLGYLSTTPSDRPKILGHPGFNPVP